MAIELGRMTVSQIIDHAKTAIRRETVYVLGDKGPQEIVVGTEQTDFGKFIHLLEAFHLYHEIDVELKGTPEMPFPLLFVRFGKDMYSVSVPEMAEDTYFVAVFHAETGDAMTGQFIIYQPSKKIKAQPKCFRPTLTK